MGRDIAEDGGILFARMFVLYAHDRASSQPHTKHSPSAHPVKSLLVQIIGYLRKIIAARSGRAPSSINRYMPAVSARILALITHRNTKHQSIECFAFRHVCFTCFLKPGQGNSASGICRKSTQSASLSVGAVGLSTPVTSTSVAMYLFVPQL